MLKRLHLFKAIFLPLLLLCILMFAGTLGYMLIEEYSFLDALYMTVITISSVGFNEVRPLDDAGRVFTIFLILINLGLFTYFISLLTRFYSNTELLTKYKMIKMENKIQQLNNHVIICGFGRNGKESALVLYDNKIPFVVVEEKNELETDLPFEVTHFLKDNATKDEALLKAGIKNARALITTLPVDADNLFVVLTAKQLNPGLTVVSRASQDSSVNKLKIAGATNVIMPDKIGGARMATLVMLPDVAELLSIMGTRNNETFKVAELLAQKSITLMELDLWKKTNCTVLGVKNKENRYTLNPPSSYFLNIGERLIVMGSDEQIREAKKIV